MRCTRIWCDAAKSAVERQQLAEFKKYGFTTARGRTAVFISVRRSVYQVASSFRCLLYGKHLFITHGSVLFRWIGRAAHNDPAELAFVSITVPKVGEYVRRVVVGDDSSPHVSDTRAQFRESACQNFPM